ncbi:SDR family oxidoreductase [Halomarina oriensis]|uniref:SDR family oxidoreductase n=1 Tax=Halomarina oriensis TaxID=671145 RepID=A0A6B0GP83_9EURY|nr:SDR family oxidoreductase [Halomarina oriensis]
MVTGGGRGIGQSISVELARNGANVVVADLDPDEMAETRRRVEELGGEALCVEMDLTRPESIERAVDYAVEEFGTVEILVNNAGIAGPTATCDEVTVEQWDQTMAVNLRGAFLMTRSVLPVMKREGYGRIVNIASVTGKRPVPHRTPYATSKMGLIGFTRSLAAEVGRYDINANVVCPGSVEGPRIERVFRRHAEANGHTAEEVKEMEMEKSARKELVSPENVARTVTLLCSSMTDQMTGQDLNVSAGKVMY